MQTNESSWTRGNLRVLWEVCSQTNVSIRAWRDHTRWGHRPVEDPLVPDHMDSAIATPAHLEIFFDLACPFCLLAKLTIDELQRSAARPATISWSPLILHPSLPAEGIDFQSAHVGRYGEQARELQRHVERRAAEFGVMIDHARITKVPSTIEAHRAVRFAARANRESEMIEALLRAYFTEYRDLTDREDVVAIVQATGFDARQFSAYLNTGESRAEVLAAHERSIRRGARSAPSYRLNGVHIEKTTDLVPALREVLHLQDD